LVPVSLLLRILRLIRLLQVKQITCYPVSQKLSFFFSGFKMWFSIKVNHHSRIYRLALTNNQINLSEF
jgi:hypothetical protein